jgi:NodT family efflux transporter outer membrane factor (OMF) lipoprotein
MSRCTPALYVCVVAIGGALLAGCAVGPNYAPPTPPAPPSTTFAAASPVTSEVQPPANWWRLYNSPDIDGLVQKALLHNKSLLVAAANLSQARAALALARAGQYPSTNLSAGAQYGVTSGQILSSQILKQPPPKASMEYSAGMDVSYELDLFGRIRRTVQAAKADYQAQQEEENAVRISVAGETTRAFVNACAYAHELDIAKQSVEVANQTRDITEQKVRDGVASDLDLARAREKAAQAKAALPIFEAQRRIALFQLAVLTGDPPEQVSEAAETCPVPPKLNTVLPVGNIQALFQRRPDIREADRVLAANVARIGVATADLFPTITIGGSLDTAASAISKLGSAAGTTYAGGPLLNWAFPNIAATLARIHAAKAAASASYASFQATVLQALQDVETALTSYANELDRNASLTLARDQSLIAFDLAQRQYQMGRVSYLDLLTAQTDFIDANATLAASDQSLASDQVTVFKALGGGWEQAPHVSPLPFNGRNARKTK